MAGSNGSMMIGLDMWDEEINAWSSLV